ncbi:TPA: FAD-dependent oxidoreductase [Burkholderia cepacia]|uniref:FAD-dependent oxidoreductase n=1 Tax=Burkholderia cepacia TaxID=292 RepID=UPI001CF1CB4B|nr:NAD(P)/FAD-dependent oxidoreductase [Burkholderia cepacia]
MHNRPVSSTAYAENVHLRHGVGLRLDVRVEALEGADLVTGIRLTSGELLACDLLVVGVGITPEIGPLLDAGAKTENGVVVDEMCATSLPDVVAVVIAQHIRTVLPTARSFIWNPSRTPQTWR